MTTYTTIPQKVYTLAEKILKNMDGFEIDQRINELGGISTDYEIDHESGETFDEIAAHAIACHYYGIESNLLNK